MIYVGIDDTDSLEEGGTGRLARALSEHLAGLGASVEGVSRHPLSKDPRVPCTRKNQCSCLVVAGAEDALVVAGEDAPRSWLESVRRFVGEHSVAGSDPGLCVAPAGRLGPAVEAWGFDAKRILLDQAGAQAVAREAGIHLESLGGSGDGIIGALAAVGLRASGRDGRLTLWRGIRALSGVLPVSRLLAEGIDAVQDEEGRPLGADESIDTGGKVRPLLRDGRRLLRAQRDASGGWALDQIR